MMRVAIRAARDPCNPNSSITATTMVGASAGAYPTNQAWSRLRSAAFYAVPVFPATVMPSSRDPAAVPAPTTAAKAS